MMSCIFRPFVAENMAFPALWSWHSPTDSADEANLRPQALHLCVSSTWSDESARGGENFARADKKKN